MLTNANGKWAIKSYRKNCYIVTKACIGLIYSPLGRNNHFVTLLQIDNQPLTRNYLIFSHLRYLTFPLTFFSRKNFYI